MCPIYQCLLGLYYTRECSIARIRLDRSTTYFIERCVWTVLQYDGRSCAGTPELPYLEVENSILDGDRQCDASLGAPSYSVTVDNSDLLLGSEEVVGEELTSQNDEEVGLPAQAPTLAVDSTPDETSHCAPDPHINDKVTNPSADSFLSIATTSLQTSEQPTGRSQSYRLTEITVTSTQAIRTTLSLSNHLPKEVNAGNRHRNLREAFLHRQAG